MKISVLSSFAVPLIMVCFIFSGMLKWFPFPVDMTIFTGGLFCLVLFFIVATERQSLVYRNGRLYSIYLFLAAQNHDYGLKPDRLFVANRLPH